LLTQTAQQVTLNACAERESDIVDHEREGGSSSDGSRVLVQSPQRNFLCALAIAWFCASFGYYGISMNAAAIGDLYITTFFSSVMEFPSYLMIWWAYSRLGRRRPTVWCFFVAGVFCALSGWFPVGNVRMCMVVIGKFFVCAVFAAIYIYSAEVFLTRVRSTAMGYLSVSARIGGILAPMLISLGPAALVMPVFAVSFWVSSAACLVLPETLGRVLPETLSDLQQAWDSTSPFWRASCCWGGYRELDEVELQIGTLDSDININGNTDSNLPIGNSRNGMQVVEMMEATPGDRASLSPQSPATDTRL